MDTNNQENQDLNNFIQTYTDKLLSELAADKMSEEDRAKTLEKIEEIVNTRIVNQILIYLPENQGDELVRIMDAQDSQALINLVSEKIPNFADKVVNDLVKLRDEILGKVIKNG